MSEQLGEGPSVLLGRRGSPRGASPSGRQERSLALYRTRSPRASAPTASRARLSTAADGGRREDAIREAASGGEHHSQNAARGALDHRQMTGQAIRQVISRSRSPRNDIVQTPNTPRSVRAARGEASASCGSFSRTPMTSRTRLKIAVVGTGISGLSAAWLLHRRHDVVVFEKADRIGGHSNTVHASVGGDIVPVDTGFIVYNPDTYPNFVELLRVLDVESELSDMSFGVSLDDGRIEYSGHSLSGVVRAAIQPAAPALLADARRHYALLPRGVARRAPHRRRRPHARRLSYRRRLRRCLPRSITFSPLASAIWSAAPGEIMAYPAAAFLRFQDNHGLLRLRNRPDWRTVKGGSQSYVSRLTKSFAAQIRTDAAIACIERTAGKAIIVDAERRAGDVSIMSSSRPTPTRRSRSCPTRARTSVRCSARFATAATKRSCTPTKR